ncbi:MAG TPA: DUF6776 family protein [Pseudomonadales bacterium]
MGFTMFHRRHGATPTGPVQVVPYRPVRRALLLVLLALTVAGAAALGFVFGQRTAELDRAYLAALEVRAAALDARVRSLTGELADVRLAQRVDAEAAQSLRDTIQELRDELGGLREEVTFYKSLMAPSSLERGLQIAELTVDRGAGAREYGWRLLLTQAAERRDWVQGGVELAVEGTRRTGGSSVEEVLPLTEVAELDVYPLKFRFRYFQNLTGAITLPDGFVPQAVRVTVTPAGRGTEPVERRFEWVDQAG